MSETRGIEMPDMSKLKAENDKANVKPMENKRNKSSQFKLRTQAMVLSALESNFTVGLMSVLTIYALFSDDIRLAGTQGPGTNTDLGFEVAISITFFFFLFEIFAAAYCKDDYCPLPATMRRLPDETLYDSLLRRMNIGSFYFYLDWIATLSLLFEMDWVIGNAFNGGGNQSAKTGTSTRAGARAGRVVRLVRMIRLVRMVKLYKYASTAGAVGNGKKKASEYREIGQDVEEEEEEDKPLAQESQVGSAMSDLTNRRVILLVLTMLIVIPQLTVNDTDNTNPLCTTMIHTAALFAYNQGFSGNSIIMLKNIVTQGRNWQMVNPLLVVEFSAAFPDPYNVPDTNQNLNPGMHIFWGNMARFEQLRTSESNSYILSDTATDGNTFSTVCTFDGQLSSQLSSLSAIYTTIFIICLLVGGTYFFSAEVNRLVINPIEKMVALVQQISINPLGVEYKDLGEKDGFLDGMETTVLLTTINKIGGLMRVGFGEAGASIISKNLADSNGGRLNLMGGGSMINSIFGFCDVRQFTDTTECLQEEVMLFVNRIAHILHSIVVQCAGSANKNIGDAFLLTWKLDDKLSSEEVSALADQALLTFCKALIELSRYQDFICNFSVAATTRLFKRFPGYLVRIGSGLHVGWAIEGAIGSNRKIDASYLSPHVNFTEFLESSTKAYGVPLLISEPFYKLLSPTAAHFLRQVDRIKKEGEEPVGMFTYDSDMSINWAEMSGGDEEHELQLHIKESKAKGGGGGKVPTIGGVPSRRHSTSRSNLEAKKKAAVASTMHQEEEQIAQEVTKRRGAPKIVIEPYDQDVWQFDQDLVYLRHQVDDRFREIWATGINAYIAGDWEKAVRVFNTCLEMSSGKDGPSKFLLNQIEEDGGVAPKDWPGYRAEGGGH